MEFIWFWIVAVMLTAYVVLDGFDLGVGILYNFAPTTAAAKGDFADARLRIDRANGKLFRRRLACSECRRHLKLFFLSWPGSRRCECH